MCNCVDLVNKKLAGKNTHVEPIWGVGKGGFETHVGVRTSKVDPTIRGKPVVVTANFCPFCGKKFGSTKGKSEV